MSEEPQPPYWQAQGLLPNGQAATIRWQDGLWSTEPANRDLLREFLLGLRELGHGESAFMGIDPDIGRWTSAAERSARTLLAHMVIDADLSQEVPAEADF